MDFGVVEMGANHVGEIKMLCEIARPDIGLITNIGRAHLEGFGGIEGVKKGKGELFEFLKSSGGLIVLNEDEPFLSELAEGARNLLKYSDCSIVMNEEEVKAKPVESGDYCALRLIGANAYEIHTALVGGYNYRNVLVALQVAGHLGVPLDVAVKVLDGFSLEINRSQLVRSGGNEYIMDAYNANPTSMKKCLDVLIQFIWGKDEKSSRPR